MPLYLTAILPPPRLAEEIDEIRKEISVKYQVFAALKPPVHITLYRPLDVAASEESRLIKLLKPIGASHAPFPLQLENFDSFNNKTLFINTPKSPAIANLQKDVSKVFYQNQVDVPEMKGNTSFHPHITIAYRDVNPGTFKTIWEEFKNRKFKRSFDVEQFSLLKHDGRRWNTFAQFPLCRPTELTLF
ncbi:2'-5' RNA ligase family protein [Pedobacter sp. SYSU D00535]|uniref:2'-5' RNA ligase family protein n=1 Tax=Pedobacter sp. SYSU D00535 TaxID=2810308 RepID=UPI001A96307D|nr:2'-5' RNA ligase family protein [Pedobacter sp. SYSU D00535]